MPGTALDSSADSPGNDIQMLPVPVNRLVSEPDCSLSEQSGLP